MASVTPQEKAGISPATQHLDARHERARVVFEVALVDAQEEDAIMGRGEFGPFAHEDEIVIVVADDRDQGAGRSSGDQFAAIGEGKTFRACALVVAQVDFPGGADHYALAELDSDLSAGPVRCGRDADRLFRDYWESPGVVVARRGSRI